MVPQLCSQSSGLTPVAISRGSSAQRCLLPVSLPVDLFCHSNKSTGKETGKTYLCAVLCVEFSFWVQIAGENFLKKVYMTSMKSQTSTLQPWMRPANKIKKPINLLPMELLESYSCWYCDCNISFSSCG